MKEDKTVLTEEQLETLRHCSGCLVASAVETLQSRPGQNAGADSSIHSLFPHLPPMVGHAATVRIRGSVPRSGSGIYSDRSDWWDYVLTMPWPRIAVVQDCAIRPGASALLGAVQVNVLRALGCVGAVTNGVVRDIPDLAALHFPVFAGNAGVPHAYVEIIDIGGPVEIGGLKIRPGELLHGDVHGVQTIPPDIAARVPQVALQIANEAEMLIGVCQSPDFSMEKLQATVARTRF